MTLLRISQMSSQVSEEHMNEYKVIVEYNSDRIVSYLPNGLFPKGILEDSAYFSHVACKLKQLETPAQIEFYHKSKQWRSLESEKDYCHAAVTLLSNHILFVSIKDGNFSNDDKFNSIGSIKKDEIVVSRDLLTSLTAQMTRLELSMREEKIKMPPVQDVYFDIDPQNNELFEFYSKIKTNDKLEEVMHGYKKYEQWLHKFNNDEKYLENQLETMLILAKHPIATNVTTKRNAGTEHFERETNNYPFTLTIYEKDLNFCFKLKNNTDIYYPNKLNIVTNLDGGSFSISVPHGIGPHNQRVFTRFKREFGNDCKISDFMYFQIKDVQGNTVLYEGIRSKFDNEQSVFKLRSVNHLTLSGINLEKLQKNNSTSDVSEQQQQQQHSSIRSSVDVGDVISTTISSNLNDSVSGRTFDEYDFLSEDLEDY